jgi:hypothetical protein
MLLSRSFLSLSLSTSRPVVAVSNANFSFSRRCRRKTQNRKTDASSSTRSGLQYIYRISDIGSFRSLPIVAIVISPSLSFSLSLVAIKISRSS